MKVKWWTLVVAVAGVAALAAGPSVADAAETTSSDSVSAVGQTLQITCGPGGPVPVTTCAGGQGLPLVGGIGTYQAASTACNMVSTEDGTVPTPEEGSCSILTQGTYENIVCGTGIATGSLNLASNLDTDDSFSAVYTIVFEGFHGSLSGTVTSGADAGAQLVGTVDIAIVPPVPPAGDCALTLEFAATLTVE